MYIFIRADEIRIIQDGILLSVYLVKEMSEEGKGKTAVEPKETTSTNTKRKAEDTKKTTPGATKSKRSKKELSPEEEAQKKKERRDRKERKKKEIEEAERNAPPVMQLKPPVSLHKYSYIST